MARDRSHDLAIEVRVLWGGDVLRVHHLAPPRPFSIGEIGWYRGITVDGDRVGAVAPSGAAGSIQTGGMRCVLLADAIEEGLAEIDHDEPDALRIALKPGRKITIALPARAGATAYRAAPAEANAGGARVVLEIALVPAERRVARAPLLEARPAVTTALAATLLLGALAAQPPPPPPVDEDGVSAEQEYLIQQYLMAAAEHELESAEEARTNLGELDTSSERISALDGNPNTKAYGPKYGQQVPDPSLEEAPFGARPSFCANGSPRPSDPLGTVFEAFCEAPPAAAATQTAFDFEPSARWAAQYEIALGHRPKPATPQGFGGPWDRPRPVIIDPPLVDVTMRRAPAEVSAARLLRAFRARHAALRDCYELGLMVDPNLAARIEVEIDIGVDGAIRVRGAPATDPGAAPIVGCMAGAVEGMRVWPAPAHVDTSRVIVDMHLSSQKPL